MRRELDETDIGRAENVGYVEFTAQVGRSAPQPIGRGLILRE